MDIVFIISISYKNKMYILFCNEKVQVISLLAALLKKTGTMKDHKIIKQRQILAEKVGNE
jgi:hypothetical protein